MVPYYDYIVTAIMVLCPFLAGNVISPFNGIVNEIIVNLAVHNLKQFHISISLVKRMLNS